MSTKVITLNNQNYLLVEVPKNTLENRWFIVYNDKLDTFSVEFQTNQNSSYVTLNTNKECYILGAISDILKDEDICKGLVECDKVNSDVNNAEMFYLNYNPKDYSHPVYEYEDFTATDSFLSWTESINLDLTKSWVLIRLKQNK